MAGCGPGGTFSSSPARRALPQPSLSPDPCLSAFLNINITCRANRQASLTAPLGGACKAVPSHAQRGKGPARPSLLTRVGPCGRILPDTLRANIRCLSCSVANSGQFRRASETGTEQPSAAAWGRAA